MCRSTAAGRCRPAARAVRSQVTTGASVDRPTTGRPRRAQAKVRRRSDDGASRAGRDVPLELLSESKLCGWVVEARSDNRVELRDRDQRDADIAQRVQQAMQCRLVDDWSLDQGGAVVLAGEGHPVEAGRPACGKVSLETDLVAARTVHGPDGRSTCGEQASPHVVSDVVIFGAISTAR